MKAIVLDNSGPTLISSDIDDVERKLGFKLPRAYRRFILKVNGGTPGVLRFPVNSLKEQIGEVEFFYPVAKVPAKLGLLLYASYSRGLLPDFCIPIGGNGIGDIVVLFCGGPRAGQVWFWDRHAGSDAPAKLHYVADSFAKFWDMLYSEDQTPEGRAMRDAKRRPAAAAARQGRKPPDRRNKPKLHEQNVAEMPQPPSTNRKQRKQSLSATGEAKAKSKRRR